MPPDAASPTPVPRLSPPRLPLFALFEAPYGMQNALGTFVPMVILRHEGFSIAQAGAISAFCLLPASFYFAYAPLADFFFRRRTWLILSVVTTALFSGATIAWPAAGHLQIITALLFSSTLASMLISAATGGLMSSLLGAAGKARVGAWVQVGNLGSNSLFFALLLLLEPHCSRNLLALVATVTILLPTLSALAIHEPLLLPSGVGFGATLLGIGRELRATFLSLRSLPGILLLASPIASSAVTSVLSGLANEYHATNQQLAFANGWGGGLLTATGSLLVLLFPARWNRLIPYAIGATIYGFVSLLIGVAPLRPATLVVGLLASNFVQGIGYAAYTGVILQTMGIAGRCHSSRYTILNSVGNLPVIYMTALESWSAGRFGPHSVGMIDGVFNLATAALFFAWLVWVHTRHSAFLRSTASSTLEPAS